MSFRTFYTDFFSLLFLALFVGDSVQGALYKESFTIKNSPYSIYKAELSQDGSKLVTATSDASVQTWELKEGKSLPAETQYPIAAYVPFIAFNSRDKQLLSVSDQGSASIIDVATGSILRKFSTQNFLDEIKAAAFLADGTSIVFGLIDGTLLFWDTKTGKVKKEVKTGYSISHEKALKVSPNGKVILTTSPKGSVNLWDAETGNTLAKANYSTSVPIHHAEFNSNGKWVLTIAGEGKLKIWQIKKEKLVEHLSFEGAEVAHFHPSRGEFLTVASESGAFQLFNLETGVEKVKVIAHPEAIITSAIYSPNGATVVTSATNREVKIWSVSQNVYKKRAIQTLVGNAGLLGKGSQLQFSRNGAKLILTGDGWVKTWDRY